MRHRFLTVTVAIVLIGLVSGQYQFNNGFQSPNFASFGNNPQAPVNSVNLQNVAPSSDIPGTNAQSNPGAVQYSGTANAAFFPQISNQPSNNNLQYANSLPNQVGAQFSPAGYMKQLFENDPIIKPYLQDSTNTNPVANGAQLFQNSPNGLPVSYVSGSNPSPNVNPLNTVPTSNAAGASFFPQFSNQPKNNNLQYANSLPSPDGAQLSPAEYMKKLFESDPIIKSFLQDTTNTNPVTNGAQSFQNSQNGLSIPYAYGSNSSPNVNPPKTVPTSNAASASFFPQFSNQPSNNNLQYANSLPHTAGTQLSPAEYMKKLFESDPIIKPYLQDSTNPNPVTNGAQSFQYSQSGFPISYASGSNPSPNVNPPNTVPTSNAASASFFPQINNQPPYNNPQYANSLSNPVGTQLSPAEYMKKLFESDPIIKPFLQDSTNTNPVTNGAQSFQNSQNGRPISNVYGSNPSPNVNSPNRVPMSNEASASFFPLISNQPSNNNLRYVNSFPNPVGTQLSPAAYRKKIFENYPFIKPFLQSPSNVNPVTNGSQQNSQNGFSVPYVNGPNPLPNISLSNAMVPLIKQSPNDPSDKILLINRGPKPLVAMQPKRRRKCKVQLPRTGIKNSTKSPVTANTASTNAVSTTKSQSDNFNLVTLNNMKTVSQVSDSSQADTKSITVYPSDTLKQYTNQNSDLTTVGYSSVQPKRKRICNKTRKNLKAKNGSSQKDLVKGQSDNLPSFIGQNVQGIPNLSNISNNNTSFRSSGRRQKPRKCQRKKEKMKALSTKGLTVASTAGPTGAISVGLTTVATAGPTNAKSTGLTAVATAGPTYAKSTDYTTKGSATTDSSKANKDKVTTVGLDSCGEDEDLWECKPLNNTCRNFARGKSQISFVCESGCFCAKYLVQDVDGTCVDPNDCAAPVCDVADHEEYTDCLLGCNKCEDDCHPCKFKSCVSGCDCKDGFKRNNNGDCVKAGLCPPCPKVISD